MNEVVRLYQLDGPCKIYAECDDGSSYITFNYVDGRYSHCTTEKGNTTHLWANYALVAFEDGYKFDDNEIRLGELDCPCKIYANFTDGSSYFVYNRVDYRTGRAFCTNQKGTDFYISLDSPIKITNGSYSIDFDKIKEAV